MNLQVIDEESVTTSSSTLKPDLEVITQQRVHVIDITVRHDDKW